MGTGKVKFVVFLAVFAFGIVLRLQNLSLLPIDAHPMRQTDTESVAYNFAFKDSNLLHPQASLIRPITNLHGYFFLEFPLYQYLISLFYKFFGWNLVVARLFNLALFILSSYFLYHFTKKIFSKETAVWNVIFFTFAPGSIFFFGHAIHPDIFAVTSFLFSLHLLSIWIHDKSKRYYLALSIFSLSLSLATRPFVLLFVPCIVLFVYLFHKKSLSGMLFLTSPVVYIFWRLWQARFPEAKSDWENWVFTGRDQLFTFVGLKTLIYKNIIGEVIGKVISILAFVGLIAVTKDKKKENIFALSLVLTLPIYWLIVPVGNISHQYYANIYIFPICLLAAIGMSKVLSIIRSRLVSTIVSVTVVSMVIYNGYRTSSYFFIKRRAQEKNDNAKDIESCLPKDSKIIYLAKNNSVSMSLAHVQGWMLGGPPADVEPTTQGILSMVQAGATHIVSGYNNTDIQEEQWNQLSLSSTKTCETKNVKIRKFIK